MKINGLQKVCRNIDFLTRKLLANGLIHSNLIYCIQLYGAAPDYLLDYLQVYQNRAARIVTRLENRTEIGKLLNQVGWLSVRQLCAYHSILLVFKSQMQVRPEYFVNKLQRRFPYNTRRSYENCFTIDNIPKTEILKKSFFFRSQTLWNQLPSEMKKLTKVEEFKRKLRAWIKEYLPL